MNIAETMWKICEERDALRKQVAELQVTVTWWSGECGRMRDESAAILAAFDDWGVWQFMDTTSSDMCGMPIDRQMEHATSERMRQLWVKRHPEFFKKGDLR